MKIKEKEILANELFYYVATRREEIKTPQDELNLINEFFKDKNLDKDTRDHIILLGKELMKKTVKLSKEKKSEYGDLAFKLMKKIIDTSIKFDNIEKASGTIIGDFFSGMDLSSEEKIKVLEKAEKMLKIQGILK